MLKKTQAMRSAKRMSRRIRKDVHMCFKCKNRLIYCQFWSFISKIYYVFRKFSFLLILNLNLCFVQTNVYSIPYFKQTFYSVTSDFYKSKWQSLRLRTFRKLSKKDISSPRTYVPSNQINDPYYLLEIL